MRAIIKLFKFVAYSFLFLIFLIGAMAVINLIIALIAFNSGPQPIPA